MWGRWLRYSSLYPNWVVRLVHKRRVRYVNRGHAETQIVNGEILDLRNDLIDENLKGIDEWFARQNRYSRQRGRLRTSGAGQGRKIYRIVCLRPVNTQGALKRLAWRVPGRGLAYFLYSYFWRRGFLEGRDGFVFCLMRSIYQTMVAIKKYDKRRMTSVGWDHSQHWDNRRAGLRRNELCSEAEPPSRPQ